MTRSEKRAFWAGHVEAQVNSGWSMVRYCREQGLSTVSLAHWKRRLGEAGVAGGTMQSHHLQFDWSKITKQLQSNNEEAVIGALKYLAGKSDLPQEILSAVASSLADSPKLIKQFPIIVLMNPTIEFLPLFRKIINQGVVNDALLKIWMMKFDRQIKDSILNSLQLHSNSGIPWQSFYAALSLNRLFGWKNEHWERCASAIKDSSNLPSGRMESEILEIVRKDELAELNRHLLKIGEKPLGVFDQDDWVHQLKKTMETQSRAIKRRLP